MSRRTFPLFAHAPTATASPDLTMNASRLTPRRILPRSAGLLLGAASLLGAGCNIIAPAYVLIHGPEKIKKVHTLEKERPTVVFVDDLGNRIPRRVLRATMATEAEQELLSKGIVKDAISAQSALVAASKDKHGKTRSIAEIGKAVGAEVVVYVTVDEFTISPDGQSFAPGAAMRAKVIDVVKDEKIWPPDEKGFSFRLQLRQRQGVAPSDTGEIAKAENELAVAAGQAISQLFYDHEPLQSAGERN